MWNPFKSFQTQPLSTDEFVRRRDELLQKAPIPCLWLLGKTGSGKSSIVRELTGAGEAAVGDGFRPQTRTSQVFCFPDEQSPLVRFFDTRGFGEAGYDPAEDIAALDPQTHLLIVTVRATDQATEAVIAPLRQIQRANPQRPALLAITCLHDAYPGRQHPALDPFASPATDAGAHRQPLMIPEGLPGDLEKCLRAHAERFEGLVERIIPIDFTPPGDGFEPPALGAGRLREAILDLLPAAYRQTLLQMRELRQSLGELYDRRATPLILGHSALAATSAAVPVPWVDIPIVIGIQSDLVHRLARLYNQPLDAQTLARMGGVVGGRIAMRFALQELLKFIPFVGMAVNAAAAFAFVFASGKAWNWYFQQIRQGHVPSTREMQSIYREQIQFGARLWRGTQSTEQK